MEQSQRQVLEPLDYFVLVLVGVLTSMVARQIDLLKTRGITAMVTTLTREDQTSAVGVSSLVDTWLLLRSLESNGERNRLLFVLKSRGSPHSNQVREFVLTDHGVELVDVYVGAAGVMTGSARLSQQAQERDAARRQSEELLRRRRELQRGIVEREAQLGVLQDELVADRAELERLDAREQNRISDTEADQSALAAQRWADSALPDE
jgi:circadian clock protein KaiC